MNKVLNVTETARLLDTDNTYVYKLIKNDQLKPIKENPYRVSFEGIKDYLNNRLPSNFACYPTKQLF